MKTLASKREELLSDPLSARPTKQASGNCPSVSGEWAIGELTDKIWNASSPDNATPMQQFIWTLAASKSLSPDQEARVLSVGPREMPDALAPMSRGRKWPGRLRLLGAEELGESIEVAFRNEGALDAMARAMALTRRPISFGHYPARSPFIDALRRAYSGRGVVVARALRDRGNPSIALDPSWEAPEHHLTSRRRSDYRRMRRTAEKIGAVRVDIINPGRDELSALMDEALHIEARGWKGRAGTAVATDEYKAKFYRHYADLAQQDGHLRLCFLRIDGLAVAMQIAVQENGRFWLLKIGYDEEYKRCSPGNLLLRETISYAAAQGLQSYEFLGKEAPWTQLWTTSGIQLVALRVYPINLSGGLAATVDASQMLSRWIMQRWAPVRSLEPEESNNA